MAQVERKLTGIPGVKSIYTRSGRRSSSGSHGRPPNDAIGRIQLEFVDYKPEEALHLTGRDIVKTIRSAPDRDAGRADRAAPAPERAARGQGRSDRAARRGPGGLRPAPPTWSAPSWPAIRRSSSWRTAAPRPASSGTSPSIGWPPAATASTCQSVGQAIEFVTDGMLAGKFRPGGRPATNSTSASAFPPRTRDIGGVRPSEDRHAPGSGAGQLLRQDDPGPAGHLHRPPRQPAAGGGPGQRQGRGGQPEDRRS